VTPAAWDELREALGGAGLIVNATTVGMRGGPTKFPCAVDLGSVAKDARVVDLVYPRPFGGLLDAAQAAGLPHQDGLPMLLWQGVRAQELWRGGPLPTAAIEAMRSALG
jgi:shikimate dehydrogenase